MAKIANLLAAIRTEKTCGSFGAPYALISDKSWT